MNDAQQFSNVNGSRDIISNGQQFNQQENFWRNGTTQLLFKHNAPKEGKEWTADLTYNRSRNGTDALYDLRTFDTDGLPLAGMPRLQKNDGAGKSEVLTFQFDYVDPLTEKTKLEWGLRSNYKINTSTLDVQINQANAGFFLPDTSLTNYFDVDDIINAAYVNYSAPLASGLIQQACALNKPTLLPTLPTKTSVLSICTHEVSTI